jgi:hypothetical protein
MNAVLITLFLVLIGLLFIVGRRADRAERQAREEVEKNKRRAWDEFRRGRDRAIDEAREEYEAKKNKFINLYGSSNDDDEFGDGSGPGGQA